MAVPAAPGAPTVALVPLEADVVVSVLLGAVALVMGKGIGFPSFRNNAGCNDCID